MQMRKDNPMSSLFIHSADLLSFHPGFKTGNDSIYLEDGIIRAIGKQEELENLVQSDTTRIDAGGKTLIPGFHDTHIHLWKVGSLKTFILDLRAAKSREEMLALLEDYAKQNPGPAWINARGFNEAAWPDGKMPTREELDKIIPSRPVYLLRTCAHIAVVNSKALELSGITKNSVPPPGGEISLDASGNPSGRLSETALGMVTRFIPAYSKEELKIMVRAARTEMYRYGITAATDPAVDPLLLEAYREMHKERELGFRLNVLPIVIPDGGDKPFPIPDRYASDFFNLNTVKFFSDGGLSGKTAALNRNYKDSEEKGVLRLDPLVYRSLCTNAMEKGLGVATHAIGDAAIDFVTGIYADLQNNFPSAIKRIEHLGLPNKTQLQLMQTKNIFTSMQAVFIHELGKNFIRYLDDEYLESCYPIRSVLDQGITMALSSDAPVVKDFNPLTGISAAVTRKTKEGETIATQEGIRVDEALRAYTCDAAKISGLNSIGSLEPGMHADLVLLEKNPLHVPAEKIPEIRVAKTFVAGVCVYSAAG